MNKEEIKHFKSLLKQGSLRHMNIILDDKFQSELLDIIKDYENQNKEIERLNNELEEFEKFQEEHRIMKQILIENNLWETLLNDDRFLEYLRK